MSKSNKTAKTETKPTADQPKRHKFFVRAPGEKITPVMAIDLKDATAQAVKMFECVEDKVTVTLPAENPSHKLQPAEVAKKFKMPAAAVKKADKLAAKAKAKAEKAAAKAEAKAKREEAKAAKKAERDAKRSAAAANRPPKAERKPKGDGFYREGSLYRNVFDACSTAFRTMEQHAEVGAKAAGCKVQNAIWSLQVQCAENHRSNKGRSTCERKDGTFKLVRLTPKAETK